MEGGRKVSLGGNSSSFLCSHVENDGGISLMSRPCGPDCVVQKSGLIPKL